MFPCHTGSLTEHEKCGRTDTASSDCFWGVVGALSQMTHSFIPITL